VGGESKEREFAHAHKSYGHINQTENGTMILPISASLVAWMTGTCHHMEKLYGNLALWLG
jgi:hypothetical protein